MGITTAERNSGVLPEDNVIHHRHMIAYQTAKKYTGGIVLEIGSGEGYGINILAPTSEHYFAIDKHLTPVNTELKNITFRQMNIPPLHGFDDNFFDAVVSFQVIEHIKNDSIFLEEIYRVLKPGACMILTTPNISMSLTRNPWHVREYTLEKMNKLLGIVFKRFEISGVFGNPKVMAYYEKNKRSVKKFTRWDILNLQYILPGWVMRIPYDIANRMNRNKLMKNNESIVSNVETEDFYIDTASKKCFDFFVIAYKD